MGKQDKYFEELGIEIGKLVDDKQDAYGDSFGKTGDILRIICPDGVKPEQYDDLLAVARILDKVFRIMTDKTALGEEPYKDIAGYGMLGVRDSQKRKNKKAIEIVNKWKKKDKK